LCDSGALSRAKSSLVVAACLFPDEAVLHYELWRVCCASGDAAHATRALGQACKTDALLEAFSTQLVADLRQPGSASGKGWLRGEDRQIDQLVRRCIAKVDLSPSADQAETTWKVRALAPACAAAGARACTRLHRGPAVAEHSCACEPSAPAGP